MCVCVYICPVVFIQCCTDILILMLYFIFGMFSSRMHIFMISCFKFFLMCYFQWLVRHKERGRPFREVLEQDLSRIHGLLGDEVRFGKV